MEYQNIFVIILIISVLLIDQFRSKKVVNILNSVFFKLVLLVFLLTLKDTQLIVLTGLFYLSVIIITHSFLEKEGFNKLTDTNIEQNYCYPKKVNGNCEHPWRESVNDSNWCCKGENCQCVSNFPPTQCFPKNSENKCPQKNMFISSDNPDLCCYNKDCKCNPDPVSPLPTTCSGKIPEEKEEEPEEPICPCNPDLTCQKIENVDDKEKDIEVTPPPSSGIKVCSYIKNNNIVTDSGKINISKDPIFDVTL